MKLYLIFLCLIALPLVSDTRRVQRRVAAVATTSRVFDGSTTALNNSIAYLNGATTFTAAMWIKSADLSQTSRYLLNPNISGAGIIYGFVNDGSGHAQVEFFGTTNERTGSQITILDTNWHHIAYRLSGAVWDRFLDGIKTNISGSVSFSFSGSTRLTIGAADGPGAIFSGAIARVYLSSSALSDAQIAAMASPTCSTSGVTGTVGYWLLGTASPDPESAPSPNTNSLTLIGTPTVGTGPVCSSQ